VDGTNPRESDDNQLSLDFLWGNVEMGEEKQTMSDMEYAGRARSYYGDYSRTGVGRSRTRSAFSASSV